VVFLHEVIEHVDDDRRTIAEALRVLRPGGRVVIFAPNRLYFFETHGVYLGRRFVFGNIPLVNWLPGRLRDVLAPHVRAYTHRGIEGLFDGQPAAIAVHSYVYPGFDNIVARFGPLGRVLRKVLYVAERTPFQIFGLSHFVILRKTGPLR
jgi:SAM-dependent methyltransferase